MRNLFRVLPTVLLTGCCYLAPCHYGTEVVGIVKDSKGNPISNAYVSLFGYTATSDNKGCFYIKKADALPFELSVQAENFKSVKSDAKWGKYQVQIELAPQNTNLKSSINWGEERREIKKCT